MLDGQAYACGRRPDHLCLNALPAVQDANGSHTEYRRGARKSRKARAPLRSIAHIDRKRRGVRE